jgi:hypothetical protein
MDVLPRLFTDIDLAHIARSVAGGFVIRIAPRRRRTGPT